MPLSALKCTNQWWHFPTMCSLSLMPPHAGALTDSPLKAGKGLTSLNFQPESVFFFLDPLFLSSHWFLLQVAFYGSCIYFMVFFFSEQT